MPPRHTSPGSPRSPAERSTAIAVQAYILIQTETGKAMPVAEATSRLEGVLGSEVLTGGYDVITRVVADDVDALGKLVMSGIQSVEGITRTLTCPVVHV